MPPHKVTGLDPSATMLDIARKSSFGKSIKWVEAFSQNFKLNQKFDLIIMTGHAFQVLLTDADVISMFASVKRRLKPTGEFVFESRNPEINWQSQWDHNYTLDIKNQKIHVEGKILSFANETMVFEHEYIFEDERLTSKSELRFMSKDNITDCAAQAGLSVKSLIGSWDGSASSAATSQEMIFTLHAK